MVEVRKKSPGKSKMEKVESFGVRCLLFGFEGYVSSFQMVFCVVGLVFQYFPVAAFSGANVF